MVPLQRQARRLAERMVAFTEARRTVADRTSPATKASLRLLWLEHRRRVAAGERLPPIWETGLRVFSQFDEDGLILFCLAVCGAPTRRVVDIGAGDGVTASNAANLILNFGFDGLLVEGGGAKAAHARRFYEEHPDSRERPPVVVERFVTRENVNEIVREAGFEGEVDFLSIDIDGNDYWIFEALTAVRPRVVCVETHTELGLEDFVAPYEADFDWRKQPAGARLGASPVAMTRLAERLGYRLVGANQYGFNTLYVDGNAVSPDVLPTIEVEELFRHGSYARGS
jgi:hypothetical protein